MFTTAQARAAGWSQDELERAVRRRDVVRVRRGCYLASAELSTTSHVRARQLTLAACAAAALCISGTTISHHGCAIAHGLPTLVSGTGGCVTIAAGTETLGPGVHVHRLRLPEEHRTRVGPFMLTSVARTCLDIACESGVLAGIVAADAAVRQHLTTRDELEHVYQWIYGNPGSVAARQVAQSADARSESPLESISRLTLPAHLPRPTLQATILDEVGAFVGRADFLWDELGVVGEADGRTKYGDHPDRQESPLWQEKERQERLTDLGLVVVRWGWREAMNPTLLAVKIERAMSHAQMLRGAGIYPRHRAIVP